MLYWRRLPIPSAFLLALALACSSQPTPPDGLGQIGDTGDIDTGSSSPDMPEPSPSTGMITYDGPAYSGVIGPAGGRIVSSVTGVELDIPAGAVTDDVTIRISYNDTEVPGAQTDATVLSLVDIQPNGLGFRIPVQLTMPVDPTFSLYTGDVVLVPDTFADDNSDDPDPTGQIMQANWSIPGSESDFHANPLINVRLHQASKVAVLDGPCKGLKTISDITSTRFASYCTRFLNSEIEGLLPDGFLEPIRSISNVSTDNGNDISVSPYVFSKLSDAASKSDSPILVNSGWRSIPAQFAIRKVNPLTTASPSTSPHLVGAGLDLQPSSLDSLIGTIFGADAQKAYLKDGTRPLATLAAKSFSQIMCLQVALTPAGQGGCQCSTPGVGTCDAAGEDTLCIASLLYKDQISLQDDFNYMTFCKSACCDPVHWAPVGHDPNLDSVQTVIDATAKVWDDNNPCDPNEFDIDTDVPRMPPMGYNPEITSVSDIPTEGLPGRGCDENSETGTCCGDRLDPTGKTLVASCRKSCDPCHAIGKYEIACQGQGQVIPVTMDNPNPPPGIVNIDVVVEIKDGALNDDPKTISYSGIYSVSNTSYNSGDGLILGCADQNLSGGSFPIVSHGACDFDIQMGDVKFSYLYSVPDAPGYPSGFQLADSPLDANSSQEALICGVPAQCTVTYIDTAPIH